MLLLFCMLSGFVLAAGEPTVAVAPLPYVEEAMLDPEFWVKRIEKSDEVRLTAVEIERTNARIRKKGYRIDPFSERARVPGRRIDGYLRSQLKGLRKWYKYDRANRRMRDPAFSDSMREKLDLEGIPKTIRVQYGLTTRAVPVRVMPTDMLVQRRPNEPDFDVLQSSILEMGHPVAGYHHSRDGKWQYVQSAICRGWVRRDGVAWTSDPMEARKFLNRPRFVVVTGKEVIVYADRKLRKKYGKMDMGATMPLVRRERGCMVIAVPRRGTGGRFETGTGYLRRDAQVSEGFLEFTARNVAAQAFKLLEVPYGWGGTERQLDCSRFVMNVLGTFGFEMPRTSFLQVKSFERGRFPESPAARKRELESLPGLGALIEFPGHIAMYLGSAGGRHYVIHSLGSYYVRRNGKDVEKRVKRVVVSDLSLGDGGKKGSLFEKASAAAVIR